MSAKILSACQEILLTAVSAGFCNGSVSTGLMHATPGDIKSFKSSADRIALIASKRSHTGDIDVQVIDLC